MIESCHVALDEFSFLSAAGLETVMEKENPSDSDFLLIVPVSLTTCLMEGVKFVLDMIVKMRRSAILQASLYGTVEQWKSTSKRDQTLKP